MWLLPRTPDDVSEGLEAKLNLIEQAKQRSREKTQPRRAPLHQHAGGRRDRWQWLSLGAMVAMLGIAIGLWPQQIVMAFPAAAKLYAQVGVKVNLAGFTIDHVVPRLEYAEGEPVLVISGVVNNVSGRQRAVPKLQLVLLDDAEQEIYAWSIVMAESPVAAHEALSFETRVPAPPEKAEAVEIRFVRSDEITASVSP
ncbi:ferric-dicitrate binding protein FerR (iron transport regulator) [Rhodoligotrophos appendicifer]|uniref:FxLYD domain-containing protein n=1 Tax=Rhodoligotrophos appendicifer TaxID=987056 RepID=UPI00147968E0|nr:FxLYD domain-containing protein [Rhodoligotrophos appendicifer]